MNSSLDPSGVYGEILHYGFILAFVGAALLAFIFFWSKGRLDMDESPKYQIFEESSDERTK